MRVGIPAFAALVSTVLAIGAPAALSGKQHVSADWKKHTVLQLDGVNRRRALPAKSWLVSGKWNERAQLPYLVYMPDKARLLLQIDRQANDRPGCMFMSSDDGGDTWCAPYFMHTDLNGSPDGEASTGLTYLGGGKLISANMRYWRSNDYGAAWGDPAPVPPSSDGKPLYEWGPLLINTDPDTGRVMRLLETRYKEIGVWGDNNFLFRDLSQACIRFSTDEGKTWGREINVPEWRGVNEVEVVRARNGDLVAVCRIDMPKRFKGLWHDNYCGMGVSIFRDDGYTWTKLNKLFDWGRQHQSPLVMPNGDIVVTYLVRRGYPNTPDGHGQFGVEAVVSRDNGRTWDLDRRYLLMLWRSPISAREPYMDMSAGCVTSSVVLPNGTILTAVGVGHRLDPARRDIFPRDVTVIKWRLNSRSVDGDLRIADARPDSDLRNKIDPSPSGTPSAGPARRNIAIPSEGARVTSSACSPDARRLLYDAYLYPTAVGFFNLPAWVEITWPAPRDIGSVEIYPGDSGIAAMPSTDCAPADYRLQYLKDGEWIDAVSPITAAQPYTDWRKANPRADAFVYAHSFVPVRTTGIRVYVTGSSDTGKRKDSPDKVIVPTDRRTTILRGIDVFECRK